MGGRDRKWANSDAGLCINTGVGGQPETILYERHQKRHSLFHRYESNTAKIYVKLLSRYGRENRRIKADSHIACSAHAVLLPCRVAKGLECVFPI